MKPTLEQVHLVNITVYFSDTTICQDDRQKLHKVIKEIGGEYSFKEVKLENSKCPCWEFTYVKPFKELKPNANIECEIGSQIVSKYNALKPTRNIDDTYLKVKESYSEVVLIGSGWSRYK